MTKITAAPEGFTLIELVTVVAIVGILSAIALPKFANLIRASSEGASKGNLGAIRSALTIYYGDMEGQYPSDIASADFSAKYLAKVPTAKTPNYHSDASDVLLGTAGDDGAGWVYNGAPGSGQVGSVWVNCTHTDTKHSVWVSY